MGFPILGQTRTSYPTAVPTFWDLEDYDKEYDLGGANEWTAIIAEVADVEISIPATGYAVYLLDYPSDDYSFQIWTGAGQTGTQFTRVDSGALAEDEYSLDWDTGAIQFAAANASETVYATYYRIMGVVRSAHVTYLQDNVEAVTDALLNGFIHGLKWLPAIGTGDKRIIDVSQLVGVFTGSDWVIYGGDAGGALTRPLGWRGDGLLSPLNILPALNLTGSIGSFSGDNRFDQGGFIRLSASQKLASDLIESFDPAGDILLDPGSELVKTDGGLYVDISGTSKLFTVYGGAQPTKGSVTIDDEAILTIDAPSNYSGPSFQLGNLYLDEGGRPVTSSTANWTMINLGPVDHGDFQYMSNMAGDESNQASAVGYWFAKGVPAWLMGSPLKIVRIGVEFWTTSSPDYISTLEVQERDADDPIVTTLLSETGLTWGQGDTSYHREEFNVSPEVHPIRAWWIKLTCANSTANSIKIAAVYVYFHLTD